ncbi:MAG: hypothetical protein HGA85_05945 [Nanoarchaeota archaeon]|nr:hypothetical protein [Nanoarchaeota archaeon]
MIDKNQVLALVKARGPIIPRDVVKILGGDTFFTGAFLSTLVDSKEIKISSAKIGGSPVYYVEGQEQKLEILYKFLNEKDKRSYDLLKQLKIIRDSEAEPLLRVSLRNIKDFAKPIEVTLGGTKEIFWRWYLIPVQEAERQIRNQLSPQPALQEKPREQDIQQKVEVMPVQPQPESTPIIKEAAREERQETIVQKLEPVIEITKEQKPAQEKKDPVPKPVKQQSEKRDKSIEESDLFLKVKSKFTEKGIEILSTDTLRKNTDIEMVILVPSPVGKLRYFCKIRDKKKSNDKDISSVFVQAQMKKLPALYVTTGDVTKKALDMLETEFRLVTILKI